jgi:hypothetical protein
MLSEGTIIDDWIAEAEALAEAREARNSLRLLLEARLGPLPPEWATRIDEAGAEWCRAMIPRAATAESLSELG